MPRPRLQRLLVEFGGKMSDIRAVGGFWQLLGGQHAPESCLGVNSVKVFWRKKTVYTAYTREPPPNTPPTGFPINISVTAGQPVVVSFVVVNGNGGKANGTLT